MANKKPATAPAKPARAVTIETPKKVQPDKYTVDEVIDALQKTKGLRTLAARQLGCAYNTIRRYIELYPEVADAEREAREAMLDNVELKLYDKCMKGDTTAIIFALKTVGKHRGYVERSEVKVDDWRSQAIEDIKAGRLTYGQLATAFSDSLAAELFASAGVPVQIGTGEG